MEHQGVPGHEPLGLAPGEVERTPGPAPSRADIAPAAPGSPSSLGAAGAPGMPRPAAPAGSPAGQPAPAGTRPSTGDTRVDEAVARLANLTELPVAEHPAVFEYVHERLTEALGDLDVRDPAGPGGPGETGGPGGPRAPGG